MNDLEKILVKNADNAEKKQEELLNNVKLLLANNEAEDIRTLSSIGLDFNLKLEQDALGTSIVKKEIQEKLSRKVVSFNEIRALCREYHLYVKPARLYKGAIPRELASELTRFCKEKGIVMSANSQYSDFYIIAPPKMFADYRPAGHRLADAWDKAAEYKQEIQRLEDQDPILVHNSHKSDNPDNDLYAVIKSWGNDFTPLRRMYGMLVRPNVVTTIIHLLMWASLGMFILAGYELTKWSIIGWSTPTPPTFSKGLGLLLGDIAGAVILIGYCIFWFTDVQMRQFRRELYNNLIRTNYPKSVREHHRKW